MSNLSERVKKAERLVFVDIPGLRTATGATVGSQGDHYNVSLFQRSKPEVIEIGDQKLECLVFPVSCEKLDISNGKLNPMVGCDGNCHHTVCYHGFGYLKHKLLERGKSLRLYENVFGALNGLNFGGELARVVSKQGDGYIWATLHDKPHILSAEENINLMRGSIDDEGID